MQTSSSDPILRMPAVQQLVPLSKQRIYSLIAQGRFPAPVALGARAVGWPQSAILAFRELIAAERALRVAGTHSTPGPLPKNLHHGEAARTFEN